MNKLHLGAAALVLLSASMLPLSSTAKPAAPIEPTPSPALAPHCEVPCGIYADQHRFEEMLEDQATIAKAIDQVKSLSGEHGAKTMNQLVRWVNTKESHATNTQGIVAQYFLTQRIKSDKPNYAAQLAAAHGVMVAAMKCKQDADPATATKLRAAILALHKAYTGKDMAHGDHDHEHK